MKQLNENLIPLSEYAKLNNKNIRSIRFKAENNGFKTAVKIYNRWFIDKNEKWIDNRKKGNK